VSVTSAPGFRAAGVVAGLKGTGDPDLALVAAAPGTSASGAAVFTTNRAAAAPVQLSRAHLAVTGGRVAGVVLNSGCANAATGPEGLEAARRTARAVAAALGVPTEAVLVCSTGLIGTRLDVERIEAAVPVLVSELDGGPDAGARAARAIMTTDTRPKEVVVERDGLVVGGMAKGAAMLSPHLATMLAVVTTAAAVDPARLRRLLGAAVDETFNCLSVDGCQSTNDTVVALSSGVHPPVGDNLLRDALTEACGSLAEQMARDAEGATRLVRVEVVGAADVADARRAARRVVESLLVKCSWHGGDPYWGRVASELGASGAHVELERLSVRYGGVEVARGGVALPHDEAAVAAHMAGPEIEVTCDLGLGEGRARLLGTDLGPGYIEENEGTS
jgi:glutamate N-acetyltransferase/amino-acid N-acetyltransferase